MLENDGIATSDLLENIYPSDERRKKGAYALFECFQSIPCNPCASSCPRGAISLKDICDLPKVDYDKCNGCGLCATVCPGLAIFIIDETFSETETLIRMPYEFSPLPAKDEVVNAANRAGQIICKAVVKNVVNTKNQNRTPIVWLSVPKQFAPQVRSFFRDADPRLESIIRAQNSNHCDCIPVEKISNDTPDKAYVCRCEEITVGEIRELIGKGYATLDEIKRVSRAGMGACQGRTCRQLIMNEIAALTGNKQDKQLITTFRPTVAPIKMGLLCVEDETND